jgi:Ca2+ transporting ATPase
MILKKFSNRHKPELLAKYKAKKADLIALCEKAATRNEFCEELAFLKTLGGPAYFQENLRVNIKTGILTSEAEERKSLYGSNAKVSIPPKAFLTLVWEAFKDLTLRMLFVAAIVSIIVDEVTATPSERPIAWIEGVAVMSAVFIAVGVTSVTNYKRDQEFQRINDIVNERRLFSVFRDGKLTEINASDIVVGDVVKIFEGMEVPVDGFVVEAHDLTADEAAMTGETDPMKKDDFETCDKLAEELAIAGKEDPEEAKHAVPSPVVLAGTKILGGDGIFITVMVGASSSIGRIKALVLTDNELSPLQEKLEKIARDIGKIGLGAAILTVVVLLLRFLIEMGIHDTWSDGSRYKIFVEYFLIGIAVLVVAIPEGLPVAVTLALAFSVRMMMKENNLVRRIEACEIMGGANNICSDKTGTLTQNKMTLNKIWNDKLINIEENDDKTKIEKYIPVTHQELFIQNGACNSSATLDPVPKGSKTDVALLQFLRRCDVTYEKWMEKHLPDGYVKFPFTSARKRQSTVLENVDNGLPSKKRMHIKGASELILGCCTSIYSFQTGEVRPITPELAKELEEKVHNMATQALRTICMAYKEIKGDEDFVTQDEHGVYEIEKTNLILFAILGIKDILRPTVKEAVKKCKRAGIKVRMVTGDNKVTAAAIARDCGIIDIMDHESLVLEGKEFQEQTGGVVCSKCLTAECDCPRTTAEAKEKKKPLRIDTIKNKERFKEIIAHLDVLARSRPIDKYALVTGLKELDNVVAVTGDGTNDAPALKKASVGFAMGISGTEVAKEAASIILLDDNFATIVKAVVWGRNIFDCIRKFLQFQLTINLVAGVSIFVGAAILEFSILSVMQLLWVNMIMDSFGALALATEPPREEVLNRRPYRKDDYIIPRKMMKHILGQAVYQITVMMVIVFAGDYWIPEFLTPSSDLPAEAIYSNNANGDQQYVRSGRLHYVDGGSDYADDYILYGPSRHLTFLFNTFVLMQLFNFVACRKINDEINIFQAIHKSKIFIGLLFLMLAGQLIIGNVGGKAFSVSLYAMDGRQWLIALAFGVGSWILNLLLKYVPNKMFRKFGKERVDPFKDKSWVMGVKRSQSAADIHRKFSASGIQKKYSQSGQKKKVVGIPKAYSHSHPYRMVPSFATDPNQPVAPTALEIQVRK